MPLQGTRQQKAHCSSCNGNKFMYLGLKCRVEKVKIHFSQGKDHQPLIRNLALICCTKATNDYWTESQLTVCVYRQSRNREREITWRLLVLAVGWQPLVAGKCIRLSGFGVFHCDLVKEPVRFSSRSVDTDNDATELANSWACDRKRVLSAQVHRKIKFETGGIKIKI